MKKNFSIFISLAVIMIMSLAVTGSALANSQTQLVTISHDGTEMGDSSSLTFPIKFSADGRFLVFESLASNLVNNTNDFQGSDDVFVRDLLNGTTTMASVNDSGDTVNSESIQPVISADGQHVAFMSRSPNLVSGFTSVDDDIFNVFVRDLGNGTTTLVSDGIAAGPNSANATSHPWAISGDGRFVLFSSSASDLVSNDTNIAHDVFVHDLQSGTTILVSVNLAGSSSSGGFWPVMSSDGRFVLFSSFASDLVSNDTNNTGDVFLRDMQTETTTLVSVNNDNTDSANGESYIPGPSLPLVSADGRFVAFGSDASDLVSNDTNGTFDAFVRDMQTGTTTLVTAKPDGTNGNGSSFVPRISPDGRFVAFGSDASDLVSNDTNGTFDPFVRDMQTGIISLVSMNFEGTDSANAASEGLGISADGRFVLFESGATDLVSDIIDTNENYDIFVRDMQTGTTTLVNVNSDGTEIASGSTFWPSISPNGQFVAFHSFDSNLVSMPDTNESIDIFVREVGSVNQPPTVSANGPYEVAEGGSIEVSATGNDPENGVLEYAWDLDNDGTFEVSGQTVTFSAEGLTAPSTQTIAVQVTDSAGLTATDQTTITVTFNTPAGNNITVSPIDETTLTFANVSSAGSTTVDISNTGPTLPSGFVLGDPPTYFDITTTATYSPPITVCIKYDATQYSAINSLRLLHYENGAWEDATSSNDTTNNVICGTVSSLSPFVVAQSAYNFSGFFQPVDNLPTLNAIKAGKAVPVKFSLSGDQGLNIMAPGYPLSQRIACESGASLDEVEQTLTAGNSNLTYDAVTDTYTYVWKTDSAWKGTCRILIVKLSDGTEHKANFKFK